jgi:hypothetical protein
MESRNIKNANIQIEKHEEDYHTPHNKIQNEFTVNFFFFKSQQSYPHELDANSWKIPMYKQM